MSATAIAPEVQEKTCTACGESWPADREFFYSGGNTKDGLMYECKACYDSRRRRRKKEAPRGVITQDLQGFFLPISSKNKAANARQHLN